MSVRYRRRSRDNLANVRRRETEPASIVEDTAHRRVGGRIPDSGGCGPKPGAERSKHGCALSLPQARLKSLPICEYSELYRKLYSAKDLARISLLLEHSLMMNDGNAAKSNQDDATDGRRCRTVDPVNSSNIAAADLQYSQTHLLADGSPSRANDSPEARHDRRHVLHRRHLRKERSK
ncbi:hypothetical protein MTO96_015822 [Rhipicephalus appendiculatus]